MSEQEQQYPRIFVHVNGDMHEITYACEILHDVQKVNLPANLPGGSEVYIQEEADGEYNHLTTTAVELAKSTEHKRARRLRGNLLAGAIGSALSLPMREGLSK